MSCAQNLDEFFDTVRLLTSYYETVSCNNNEVNKGYIVLMFTAVCGEISKPEQVCTEYSGILARRVICLGSRRQIG